ncbi:MAG: CBS domain-containing protein [Spirochaetales bacterium]|jgi:CBS domain-containing protein/anti-sigma regulatory factor (Ser/Thr protein kinase)|nr:CBS domain-containing protein [Spirochaetales bacterium]
MKILPEPDGQPGLVFLELIQGLRIRDVMTTGLITACLSDSLCRIRGLMKENRISGVPIVADRRLLGIISLEDIMNALAGHYIEDPAEKHMTRSVVTLDENMPLTMAVDAFEKYPFNRFPVLNESQELSGIISSRDITMRLLTEMNREFRRLEASLGGKPAELEESVRRYPVRKHDFTLAGTASTTIKKILKEKGIEGALIRRVAVAAYEMEMNQTVHSLGGELVFICRKDRVELIARDFGPGIDDPEAAMREGYSTATEWIRSLGFGAGMGLPNIKKVSDEFSLKTGPGGTEIAAVFYLNDNVT